MRACTHTRQVSFGGDALDLYERLGGRSSDTMLFGSPGVDGRDGQTMLFTSNAVRIEGRGRRVTLTALSENGLRALDEIGPELPRSAKVGREAGRVEILFPERPRSGPDIDRIRQPSSDDVLRLLATGWSRPDPGVPAHLPGVFSYDHVEQLEPLPAARADIHGFPDFLFWLPGEVVVVDHSGSRALLEVNEYGECPPGDHAQALARMMESLRPSCPPRAPELVEGIPHALEPVEGTPRAPELVEGTPRAPEPVEGVDLDDRAFADLVSRLKRHIAAGDVFQIVPSRTFSVGCARPLAAFRELSNINPCPYRFYVSGEGFDLFGASPEASVRVDSTPRRVELHPIAGTRPRGFGPDGAIDPDLDGRLESELSHDEKELAEHMMLVDLARNDVARICRPGTRRVSRLLEVERYSHVMHLTSVVEGELRDDLDALHAYLASANMGTLVGAPKIEAARILRRCEPDRRGPYGGAVGYLRSDGAMETAIVIRAAFVRDGIAHVRAGAGVVFDSDPAREADETRDKASAVLDAIRLSGEVRP